MKQQISESITQLKTQLLSTNLTDISRKVTELETMLATATITKEALPSILRYISDLTNEVTKHKVENSRQNRLIVLKGGNS